MHVLIAIYQRKILSYLTAFAAAFILAVAFPAAFTASAYEIPEWKETSLGVFTAKGISYENAPENGEGTTPVQMIIPVKSLTPSGNYLSNIKSMEIAITVNGEAGGGLGYKSGADWINKT